MATDRRPYLYALAAVVVAGISWLVYCLIKGMQEEAVDALALGAAKLDSAVSTGVGGPTVSAGRIGEFGLTLKGDVGNLGGVIGLAIDQYAMAQQEEAEEDARTALDATLSRGALAWAQLLREDPSTANLILAGLVPCPEGVTCP